MTRGPWRPYAARALFASRHLFVLPSLIKSTPTPLLNSPILTHKFCRRTLFSRSQKPSVDTPTVHLGNANLPASHQCVQEVFQHLPIKVN